MKDEIEICDLPCTTQYSWLAGCLFGIIFNWYLSRKPKRLEDLK